jgi:hypothetical protein
VALLGAWRLLSTNRCLCGLGGDGEVGEEGLHVDAEGFVVAVDCCPVSGFAPKAGAVDAGDDGADDLVA